MNAFISAKVGAYVAEDVPDLPKVLSAEEVAALAAEGRLPVATFDANGVPAITIPDSHAPADLAVQVLTEGTGETIRPNDQFTALYTGWTWADGPEGGIHRAADHPCHDAV